MRILEIIKQYRNIFLFYPLLIFIAVIYWQSLKYDYTYFDDDVLILENYDFISDYKNIPKFFTKSVFLSEKGTFYRPVFTMSLAVDAMIAGKNPFIYRLSGVLLHVFSVFLIYIFFIKLKFNETLSFLFAALFAVHPAFVHAVAWIPGRNDLLLAVFVLLSFIFLLNYFEGGKKYLSNLIISFFMITLALFTKESAAVMIVVVPVFMFLFCKNVSKKDYLTVFGVSFLIICFYTILRFFALSAAVSLAWFDIPKAFKSVFVYCEYMIMPFRIHLFPENVHAGILTFISCLIVLIPLAASFIFNIGRKKVVLFGALWFLIFLSPSFLSSGFIFAFLPHRLYIASVGFIIMFLEFFGSVQTKNRFAGKYIAFILAALIIIYGFLSYTHVKKFQDKYVYILRALEEQPESEFLRLKMAGYYADEGMFNEAKNEISKIKRKDGGYSARSYELLGYIYSLEGSHEKAIIIFEQLLDLFPDYEVAIYNLSELYAQKNEYDKALEYADKIIKMRPENADYAVLYEKIKNLISENNKILN